MAKSYRIDPFMQARRGSGVLVGSFAEEKVPMILRYREVRKASKDWRTFSSDAPARVPVPDETDIRSLRQLPLEIDPPAHTACRDLVGPIFRRPTHPDYIAKMEALVAEAVTGLIDAGQSEIVGQFALPLQSRALALLLGVPPTEAEEWIDWGIHAFRVDGKNIPEKAHRLDAYIAGKLDEAVKHPGDDFFSTLAGAKLDGRPLSRAEMEGFAHIAFAGGRDTVIHLLAGAIGHLAQNPPAFRMLKDEPGLAISATEEFVRFITPLTHIGRVCRHATEIHGIEVLANDRIALCWASANYDETIFDEPEAVRLDRNPNPHVGFGSGHHTCLGAPQARLILRSVLKEMAKRISRMSIVEAEVNVRAIPEFSRPLGYEKLVVNCR